MAFELRLIFASDLEGGSTTTLNNAIYFAAITEALKGGARANLLVSAGDNYIPGPFYNAGGIRSAIRDSGILNDVYNQLFGLSANGYDSLRELPGVVDIAIMNAIGFDASAVGNHEFDAGSSAFADLIAQGARDPEGPPGDRYVGTLFPYLSANLDFSGDGLAGLFEDQVVDATAGAGARTIAPAVTFDLTDDNGSTSKVGVIGATTPVLSTITSPGGVVAEGTGGLETYPQTPAELERVVADLASVLQPVVDAVIAEGVNKVVMVTHLQQSQMEQLLIQRLRGVDVMVAGGSGASFFDDGSTTSTEDDVFATQNADGDPAYVVSVPGLYSMVGVVDLQFDNNGIPSIVSAKGLESTQDTVNAVGGDINGQTASLVSDLVEAVQDVVFEKDQIIYGYTDTYLQGNREFIRTEETNFGNLAADSQLWKAQQIDPEITVSLKNGGGLRAPIGDIGGTAENPVLLPPRARTIAEDGYFKPEGAISQLDLENTLRFNNDLVIVETTAAGLQALMEHAISASATGNTPGQFAQIGGMRLQFDYEQDYSNAPGSQRIRSLVITGENDSIIDVIIQDGELQGNPDRPIKMVTLDFLANNDGDSYPFSEVASSITKLQINGNDVSEQVALAEYLQAFYGTPETAFSVAETSVENDLRIINNGRGNRNTILNDAPIGSVDLGGSEIASYASDHEVALVITGKTDFQVVDLSDPTNPRSIADINLGAPAQSVDVVGDLVAVAVADPDNEDTANGNVVFFKLQGSGGQTEATRIGEIEVGALPDSLKFSSDGRRLVVANEAQSIDVPDPVNNDAAGSISVIDTSSYATTGSIGGFTVNTIDFLDFNGQEVKLNLQGIRIRNTNESGSVAQDLEPEFVAVLGNRAWVSLQENNAIAEIDLTTNQLVDIWSLGIKDWKRGTPVATNLPFEIAYPGDQLDRGNNGRLDPGEVVAGGLSGAWFDGSIDGVDHYYVVTDRGPQAFDIGDRPGDNPNDPNSGEKVFDDPDYPITVYKLARTANGLNQVERITLKVPDGAGGFRNATGIGALPAHDPAYTKVGVDADGFNVYEEVARDAFGIDAESILVISIDGLNNGQPMFAISEEYFPGIYLFDQASGELVQRIVPEGSDFSAVSYEPGRGDSAAFTLQTLPSHYSDRRNNRGFEGMAFNSDDGLLYAFIQSPMRPDGYKNGSNEFIRILAVDPSTGQAQAEYLHLLSDEAGMDKIGDAVYDASTGRFLIIERDSNLGSASNKAIIEIDLSGATNVLEFTTQDGGWSELIGVEQPETLPTESIADSLAQVGVVFANRVELINLPSIGADSRFDKPEGLALKDDGSLVIFNDNDFVNVAGRPDNLATEINFIPQPLDTSNRDEAGGAFGVKNLYGIPMPDGIAAYQSNGNTYIIATGEGDDRDGDGDLNDAERAKDVAGVDNNDIGDRLKLVTTEGDYNGDGAIDQPYAFGSRSFRIYDDGGNLIFDSGNQLDEIAKAYGVYDDGRSDDKGMEPEAVTTQTIDGEVYAFIALERAENSTVLVYNVTDPLNSRFTQVLINPAMTTTVDGEEVIEVAEAWGPESLTFIQTRANGEGILMVANEGDDYSEESQLDFYRIPQVPSYAEYKTIGSTTALIPEAGSAIETEWVQDGKSGNTNFPYGSFKPLATVGEVDPKNGYALTGYPDGNAAWLNDDDTIRVAYQSESYGTISNETYPQYMTSGVSFTGSKVHTIDYNRAGFAEFLSSDQAASEIFEGSGFLFNKVYNVFGEEVDGRNTDAADKSAKWGNQTNPDGTLVEFKDSMKLTKGDFYFHSFCGSWYEPANKYGSEIGFEDDVWLMAEEWNIGNSVFDDPDGEGPLTGTDVANETMGLASMVVDIANETAYTVPALGQTGYEKILPINSGHEDFVVLVMAGYNHNQEPAPNRIYVGLKDKLADGTAIDYNTASERDAFLARNGLLYGKIYGLALDDATYARLGISPDPTEKMVDDYMKNGNAPDTFSGKFVATSYQWDGFDSPESVKDTEMLLWEKASEQPEGHTFFNGDTKTEHPAVDPDITKSRYVQNMTDEGGILGFDLGDLGAQLSSADGKLPTTLDVDVTRIVAAVNGDLTLKTNGEGLAHAGGDQNPDGTLTAATHVEKGVAKMVAPDGLLWVKNADGDFLIVDEDSGNDYGERKYAIPLNSADMTLRDEGYGYFLAQAGGKYNPRAVAGASALGDAYSSSTSAEFSGSWNVTALVAKKEDGSFYSKDEIAGTKEQEIIGKLSQDDQQYIGVVQMRGESGGQVADLHADAGGQIFMFDMNLPTSAIPELIANEWFDQVTGQYLYVTTPQEGSVLLGNPNWNQTQDQLTWFTPGEASDSLFNIVRLYNPATGDHVYTINSNEIEFIETELNYINEGVVGRAYNTQTPDTDAIYRFSDPIAGTHAMSTDPNGFGGNFINEGIVFYA